MTNKPKAPAPIDMDLDHLVSALATAKATEGLAVAKRIEWEQRVAAKIGGPEDGQKTTTLKDGTKITVKRGFLFDADCEGIAKLFRRQQYDHAAPIKSKTTVKLDEPAYKAYAKRFPATYRAIQEFVKVKPKKTAVTLDTTKVGKK